MRALRARRAIIPMRALWAYRTSCSIHAIRSRQALWPLCPIHAIRPGRALWPYPVHAIGTCRTLRPRGPVCSRGPLGSDGTGNPV